MTTKQTAPPLGKGSAASQRTQARAGLNGNSSTTPPGALVPYGAWALARLRDGADPESIDQARMPSDYLEFLGHCRTTKDRRAAFDEWTRAHPRGESILWAVFAVPPGLQEYPLDHLPADAANEAHFVAAGLDIEAPELPEAARLSDKLLAKAETAGSWLTDYMSFASVAAPMTPVEYHQVLGLMLLSAAVARRLVLKVSLDDFYPNLYALLVGQSTIIKKSTAFRIANHVLSAADLRRMRLSDSVTPESLIDELTGELPPNFDRLADGDRTIIEQGRAFAGQRAWWMEEASGLFEALQREHLAALRNMVLDLWDCPAQRDHSTRNGGRKIIKRAYLSICGPTTYGAMKRHFKSAEQWENGLFSRFVIVTPASLPVKYVFYPELMEVPPSLTAALRTLALERLPMPGKPGDDEPLPALTVVLGEGVWEAWTRYSQALEWDLVQTTSVPERLKPNYGRLKMMAIKTAMLLAAADWASGNSQRPTPLIELRHWARAQVIAESWRASLHRLLVVIERTGKDDVFEELLSYLPLAGEGLTTREVAQRRGKTDARGYAETRELLQLGQQMNLLRCEERAGRRGPAALRWYRNV